VEVDAVASVWVNVGFKLAGVRECCTDSSGYTSEGWITSRQAIAPTIDRIDLGVSHYGLEVSEIGKLTLTTGQDESWTSKGTSGRGSVTKSEDLSKSDGLLSTLSKESGTNIEVARIEEGVDVGCGDELARYPILQLAQLTSQIAPGKISCRKVLCDWRCGEVPAVNNVTELSGSNLLPDIRGREVDTNSTKSRLEDRDQALAEPSSVGLAT
jgi:hypothetical protein